MNLPAPAGAGFARLRGAAGAGVRAGVRAAGLPVGIAVLDGLVVNGFGSGPGIWVALAAAAALLVRRRVPELPLLVGLPGLYVGHLAFAPLIALYGLADRRRRLPVAVAGAVLVALAQFLPYPIGKVVGLGIERETLLMALDAAVLGAGAVVLGRTARIRRERLREVTESREREHRLLAERARATERARLAREMHDVVAHQVSLISLHAGALQVSDQDAAGVRETAGLIRELSVKTLTELQHTVGVLRAAAGGAAALTPQPRLSDLPALIRDCGLRVTLDAACDAGRWPVAVERAAYRTVQEALTNVRKHAPGAEVQVSVRPLDGRLQVEISNTPGDRSTAALGLPGGGHGLVGLRERAHLLGGTFRSERVPDGGFRVRAAFPF